MLSEEKIKNISLNESNHFVVKKYPKYTRVELNESFQKCFPDDIELYNQYLIESLKRENGEINIIEKNNTIFIRENDMKKYVKNPFNGQITEVEVVENVIRRDFWKQNDISEIINEIVNPDSISVDDFQKKDELCTKIWDNEKMKMHPEIRQALLRIAKEFIEYAELEEYNFEDVTLTGSLANYNYSDESDLDVHILMDYSQISDNEELVRNYLKNKKTLWNENMPIMVKDHQVEMYVQDNNEPHTSTGVYSLVKDKWKTEPIKELIQLDTNNIQKKAAEYMDLIDDIMENEPNEKTIKKIEKVFDKIKAMRKSGLEKEGEFSVENIVFKILRRNGYIEKLVDFKRDIFTKELTVEEKKPMKYKIKQEQLDYLIKRKREQRKTK